MAKDKLNNLLSFTKHNEKYNKPAKKTKRTDVAKDVLEKKIERKRKIKIDKIIESYNQEELSWLKQDIMENFSDDELIIFFPQIYDEFFDIIIEDSELEMLEIEISVLSPLKETETPERLRLGIDGIYIVQGNRTGCFLPQVATECNWTEEQFLSYCCIQKAQLPPDAWKDPETEVYLFSADVFSEHFIKIYP